jgi:hypothetical protein
VPTFEDDVDYDRTNSFLDTTGYGHAVTVSHKNARTGTTTAGVKAIREEMFYAVFDDKEVQRYHVNPGQVTVERNDQIVDGTKTWTVVDIRDEGPEIVKLTCTRSIDRM